MRNDRILDPFNQPNTTAERRLGVTPQRDVNRAQERAQRYQENKGLAIVDDEGRLIGELIRELQITGAGLTVTVLGNRVTIDASASGGTTIAVQEGDVTESLTVSVVDFDDSSFDVTISPAGEANVDLAYGTGAGQPAEGNHTHSYQPLDADLTAIAGLTSAADKLPYFTGAGTAALADLSAFGRTLIDDAANSNARTTLGLVIGTDVQAYDADLGALAANGTNGIWARTGAGTGAARTIAAADAKLVVTNGDGVAGAPTVGFGAVALSDLSDVDVAGASAGKVVGHDGTDWQDRFCYNFALGPFFVNDLPGTATTQATLGFFNTATALSRSANDLHVSRGGRIVGLIVDSDANRTAGTATIRVRVAGTGAAFNAGSVVLDGTNVNGFSDFVGFTTGVSYASNDRLGIEVTTSGWTPTTANLAIWLVVQLSMFG